MRVFLDANVLAKPVTRTLLMAGGPPSGFRTVWSGAAEQEALRHMPSRAVSPAVVRRRFGGILGPIGDVGERFGDTAEADRQILADAEAAGAAFLVSEDVDDFRNSVPRPTTPTRRLGAPARMQGSHMVVSSAGLSCLDVLRVI